MKNTVRFFGVFLFLFICSQVKAQTMSISGTVTDTTNFKPVRDASVVIIRLSDSIIVDYGRTDIYGKFSFPNLVIDTVEVLITHPKLMDLSFYVLGSEKQREFQIDDIVVSENVTSTNEVIIFASKDPVYYRGDTLVFVADSFDVKTNAVVEDLLKRLPGVEVDDKGDIQFQGKEVEQVLVDGDEFFGSNHLVATRNLDAKAVENVEVYEKERENAEDGSTETVQIMNLKLKEEAKEGYFGRIAAGSDFQRFYEGEALASKFNGKRKASVYFQGTNTPNSGFSWEDSQQYGIQDDRQSIIDEDGDWVWFGSPQREGLPQSLRGGVFLQDQLTKKLFATFNYGFKDDQLTANSELSRQFFFPDSTYSILDTNRAFNRSFSHVFDLKLDYKIDSFTTLEIKPQFKISELRSETNNSSSFLDNNRELFSTSSMINSNLTQEMSFSNVTKLTREFRKKYRKLELTHQIDYKDNTSDGNINSRNVRTADGSEFSVFDQRKEGALSGIGHLARAVYWEPLSRFWRLEFEYQLNYFETSNSMISFNKIGEAYTDIDSLYSNSFENQQMVNMAGAFGRYDKGKHMFRFGTRLRNNQTSNLNLFNNEVFTQNVNNVLPRIMYRFKPKPSLRLNISYSADANLPNITQLQPLLDNTNPNQISIGNADLVPSYSNNLNINFNNWNGIKNRYVYAGLWANQTNNAFSSSIVFNADGQTESKVVNVDGVYSAGMWSGFGFPLHKDILKMNINANSNYSNRINFINDQENITRNLSVGGSLSMDYSKLDTLYFDISISSDYNNPQSTLGQGANQPFWQHSFDAFFEYELPWNMSISADANYNILTQRADGFNQNFLIVNARFKKRFLKEENLMLELLAMDILNQNITISRNITTNMIIDSRTQIISRYFLVKLTYNFKNKITKKETDETFE